MEHISLASRQKVSFIVAFAKNGVMGRNNQLPWNLPDDLAFFKKHTLGKPIVMGRKTWQSINRMLPNRINIVISRSDLELPQGVLRFASIDAALDAHQHETEIMIIGGAQIFHLAQKRVNRMYLTRILANVEGDVYMPNIDYSDWQLQSKESHERDARHDYAFDFEIWDRVK